MSKFKVGDKVERVKGQFAAMLIGDTGTVTRVEGSDIFLSEYVSGGHSADSLVLHSASDTEITCKVKDAISSAKQHTLEAYGYIPNYKLIPAIIIMTTPYINYKLVSGPELDALLHHTIEIINKNHITNDIDAIYSSIQFFLK